MLQTHVHTHTHRLAHVRSLQLTHGKYCITCRKQAETRLESVNCAALVVVAFAVAAGVDIQSTALTFTHTYRHTYSHIHHRLHLRCGNNWPSSSRSESVMNVFMLIVEFTERNELFVCLSAGR